MRKNKARFIKVGITDVKGKLVYISKQSLKVMEKTIVGKPVYRNHDYDTKPEGKVTNAYIDGEWLVGEFTSENKYPKVSVGYMASRVTNSAENRFDNVKYDLEMKVTKAYELSGIDNNRNRYTNANVTESVFVTNSVGDELPDLASVDNDEFIVYNSVDVDESIEEIKEENKGIMFNFKKENIDGITDQTVAVVKNSKDEEVEMTLGDLKVLPARVEELEAELAEVKNSLEEKEAEAKEVEVDGEKYDADAVKALKEKAEAPFVLNHNDQDYSVDDLKSIIDENSEADEDVKNAVEKSKEYSKDAKAQNQKIRAALKKINK